MDGDEPDETGETDARWLLELELGGGLGRQGSQARSVSVAHFFQTLFLRIEHDLLLATVHCRQSCLSVVDLRSWEVNGSGKPWTCGLESL